SHGELAYIEGRADHKRNLRRGDDAGKLLTPWTACGHAWVVGTSNARVQLRANQANASEASYHSSPVGCSAMLCRRRYRCQKSITRLLYLGEPMRSQRSP